METEEKGPYLPHGQVYEIKLNGKIIYPLNKVGKEHENEQAMEE